MEACLRATDGACSGQAALVSEVRHNALLLFSAPLQKNGKVTLWMKLLAVGYVSDGNISATL